jgi:chromosomal replication initiator protein
MNKSALPDALFRPIIMLRTTPTFARFTVAAENRAALLAVQDVAACVYSRRPRRACNPLLLHGPPGVGKTHLASALVAEVTRNAPDLVVTALSADETEGDDDPLETARRCDLLVIEDLQHLPLRSAEKWVQLFDYLHARDRQMVFTANAGPQQLNHRGQRFPARLTSRLAGGLVVHLAPLNAAGRLALLKDQAQRRQIAVGSDVLAWLAEHLTGGGRQLEGALTRLEMLARMQKRPLDVATVADHFREQAEASRPTVERIAERVSGYFQVRPQALQSRRRYRNVLLPRQVGMYLARRLTTLSLNQIGAYFGGWDHSTVRHACKKIETTLAHDAVLSGAVRQLHADLA